MNHDGKCRMFFTSLETEKWPSLKGCLATNYLPWRKKAEGGFSCAFEENPQNKQACSSFPAPTHHEHVAPRHRDSTQSSVCGWGHVGRSGGGCSLLSAPQLDGTVVLFPPAKKSVCVYSEVETVANGIHICLWATSNGVLGPASNSSVTSCC